MPTPVEQIMNLNDEEVAAVNKTLGRMLIKKMLINAAVVGVLVAAATVIANQIDPDKKQNTPN